MEELRTAGADGRRGPVNTRIVYPTCHAIPHVFNPDLFSQSASYDKANTTSAWPASRHFIDRHFEALNLEFISIGIS